MKNRERNFNKQEVWDFELQALVIAGKEISLVWVDCVSNDFLSVGYKKR